MRWLVMWCLTVSFAYGEGERAGDFDYYVLALSWEPSFCELEGYAKGREQCDRLDGWTLHGLWPQNTTGWPSYCKTSERPPSRSQTRGQTALFGSSGSAWHQWKKHGSCSGLSASAFYDLSQKAMDRITAPPVFLKLDREVKLPASVVEEAFLQANPALMADGVTVTCRSKRIQEVRICLTKDLEPRRCGRDVIRDCTLEDALFSPSQ
ncbi:MAG: ribonuclease T2 [Pseudomonadota bacterium]